MLTATTILFLITTILFGLMALAPSSAPIKTSNTREAVEASETKAIETVAKRFTENLLTYKYQTAEQDVDRALRDTTDQFRTAEHQALGGTITQFRQKIINRQGTSEASVKGMSTTQNGDTASVLVTYFRTSDNASRQPTSGYLVVELTLVKTGGAWKVDTLAAPDRTTD